MKSIIVNLSKNNDSIKQVVDQAVESKQCWSFIDFSGSRLEFANITCISVRKLDSDNKIEKSSIHEYVNTVGDLSVARLNGENIRQLQINGLPIYWLTNFAEKHPFKHWLLAFFFFKGFLKEKPDFFNDFLQVIIIAPVSRQIFNAYVEQHWPWLSEKSSIVTSSNPVRLTLSKTFYIAASFFLKYTWAYVLNFIPRRKSGKPNPPDLFFINGGNSPAKSTLQEHVSAFLKTQGSFLEVHLQSIIFKPTSSHSIYVAKYYPSPFAVAQMFYQIFKCSKKAAKYYSSAIANNDFLQSVISEELYKASQLIRLYFMQIWLSKIFSATHKSMRIIYEDEMYKIGRVISSAAVVSNNHHIKAIAYQHGNISENHSVYRFCNAEILESRPGSRDAVPLPDIFLVWGEYFKRQFLEWVSLNPEKVVVAGNLVYLALRKKYSRNSITNKKIKNILWCTTSFEFAKGEYEIMQRELENNDFCLFLRMHPNYDIKDDLRDIIPGSFYSKIIWETTLDIYEAINNADLVVGSGHSTVFIDCIILNKPVIRIFNYSVMNDYLTSAQVYIKNAFSQEEFAEAMAFFRSENKLPDISGYLFLESDEIWKKEVCFE